MTACSSSATDRPTPPMDADTTGSPHGLSSHWGRRDWLVGAGALAAGTLLAGCGRGVREGLGVVAIEDTIPSQLLRAFEQAAVAQGAAGVQLRLLGGMEPLLDHLQDWQSGRSQPPDWRAWIPFLRPKQTGPVGSVTLLSHAWLSPAVRSGWLQPWPAWPKAIAPTAQARWQPVAQANAQGQPDRAGQLWGIPYRWGTTALVYRPDKFAALGWEPRDWSDLWRPELRGKVVLLDRMRETIGLALKRLGHSYNELQPQAIAELPQTLAALHRQALVYADRDYIQPVLMGDAWVAVGWSNDLVAALSRQKTLRAIVPQSGTALWADLWVRPSRAPESVELATLWAGLPWQPNLVQDLAGWFDAAPAAWLAGDRTWTSQPIRQTVLLPDGASLDRSDFIQPLPPGSIAQYQQLWQTMRQATTT